MSERNHSVDADHISSLPYELLLQIFGFLTVREIIIFGSTCKDYNNLINSSSKPINNFWRLILLRKYGNNFLTDGIMTNQENRIGFLSKLQYLSYKRSQDSDSLVKRVAKGGLRFVKFWNGDECWSQLTYDHINDLFSLTFFFLSGVTISPRMVGYISNSRVFQFDGRNYFDNVEYISLFQDGNQNFLCYCNPYGDEGSSEAWVTEKVFRFPNENDKSTITSRKYLTNVIRLGKNEDITPSKLLVEMQNYGTVGMVDVRCLDYYDEEDSQKSTKVISLKILFFEDVHLDVSPYTVDIKSIPFWKEVRECEMTGFLNKNKKVTQVLSIDGDVYLVTEHEKRKKWIVKLIESEDGALEPFIHTMKNEYYEIETYVFSSKDRTDPCWENERNGAKHYIDICLYNLSQEKLVKKFQIEERRINAHKVRVPGWYCSSFSLRSIHLLPNGEILMCVGYNIPNKGIFETISKLRVPVTKKNEEYSKIESKVVLHRDESGCCFGFSTNMDVMKDGRVFVKKNLQYINKDIPKDEKDGNKKKEGLIVFDWKNNKY